MAKPQAQNWVPVYFTATASTLTTRTCSRTNTAVNPTVARTNDTDKPNHSKQNIARRNIRKKRKKKDISKNRQNTLRGIKGTTQFLKREH